MALASDFPRIWNDPRTPVREKKRHGGTDDRGCDAHARNRDHHARSLQRRTYAHTHRTDRPECLEEIHDCSGCACGDRPSAQRIHGCRGRKNPESARSSFGKTDEVHRSDHRRPAQKKSISRADTSDCASEVCWTWQKWLLCSAPVCKPSTSGTAKGSFARTDTTTREPISTSLPNRTLRCSVQTANIVVENARQQIYTEPTSRCSMKRSPCASSRGCTSRRCRFSIYL